MNHKRKKSKRNVKCTLCTSFRWFGNRKGRRRKSYLKNEDLLKNQLEQTTFSKADNWGAS